MPVFMADALIRPLENRSPDSVTIPVDYDNNELFRIPLESAVDADKLTKTIDYMDDMAKLVANPEQTAQLANIYSEISYRICTAD